MKGSRIPIQGLDLLPAGTPTVLPPGTGKLLKALLGPSVRSTLVGFAFQPDQVPANPERWTPGDPRSVGRAGPDALLATSERV